MRHWLTYLRAREYDSLTMAYDMALEKQVSMLTPDEITAAMRRVLDPSQIVIIKGGNFKKARPQLSRTVPS